ncbi:Zn finger protein HypA/HybF involved in hydrogenase expression [Bradyrhizobium embrapense]
MLPFSTVQHNKCVHCGSGLVTLEWHEHVSANEAQDLWRCWNCKHQFVSVVTSDERELSAAEITRPFFTSLLV